MPPFLHYFIQQMTAILSAELWKLGGNRSITTFSLLTGLGFLVLFFLSTQRLNSWIAKAICRTKLERRTKREAFLIVRYSLYPAGLFIFVRLIGLDNWLYKQLLELQLEVKALVDLRLFTIGKTELTLWTILYLLILSWLLVRLTSQCETWFVGRILSRTRLEHGMRDSLRSIFRYLVITIGMMVIIQSAGIDLSALTIMAGGFAVAIGLAMQSIMNNLVSGLVILFERPIKVGDRVDIGTVTGDVTHISLRATTIVTGDDIAIIVPNSEFTTQKVVNWTYTSRTCRFKFTLRVAADSDPDTVRDLLLRIAENDPAILSEPAPKVLFEEFGDTTLTFSLLVWSRDYVLHPADLKSNLNFAISKALADHGIKLHSNQSQLATINSATTQTESFAPSDTKDKSNGKMAPVSNRQRIK